MSSRYIPPVIRFVRSLEGEWLTLSEVARAIQVPEDTLRGWRRTDPATFGPTELTHLGDLPVCLYSLEDLERVRVAAKHNAAGKPRMWSADEVRSRRARTMKARYYEVRAAKHTEDGDLRLAASARATHLDLRRELAAEATARRRELGMIG